MVTLNIQYNYRLIKEGKTTSQKVLVDVESDSTEKEINAQIMYHFYKYIDTPDMIDIYPYEIIN